MISDNEYDRLQYHIEWLKSCVESYQDELEGTKRLRDNVYNSIFVYNSPNRPNYYLSNANNIAYLLMLNDISKQEILSMSHEEGLAYIWLLIA